MSERGRLAKEIARFETIGESGRLYVVVEYQRQLMSGRQTMGSTFLNLADGRDVNDMGDEPDTLFEIFLTGEQLRRR